MDDKARIKKKADKLYREGKEKERQSERLKKMAACLKEESEKILAESKPILAEAIRLYDQIDLENFLNFPKAEGN